jgi:hypothetical protein
MKRMCLGLLLLAACGCGRQDVDRLARMGRAAAVKCQGAAATAQKRLPPGLSEMRIGVADTLEGRIQTRLRWDRLLHDAAIEARAEGGVIELRGTVADEEQRNWAVRLAESTVGVERVTDNLTVGAP